MFGNNYGNNNYGNNNYGGFGGGFNNYNNANPFNLNLNPTNNSSGNFYYINGIEGAKAFLIQPNTRVVLFDSDSNTFFVKTANAQGQATLQEFEFKERSLAPKPELNNNEFVSRKEFEEFKATLKKTAPNTTIQKQSIAENKGGAVNGN